MPQDLNNPLDVTATIIVSGLKQPITLLGAEIVRDFNNAVNAFLKSTAKPVGRKGNEDYYNNYFMIDEFCVTFLDWVRIHDCGNPLCQAKDMRDSLIDFLSDKCIEQTVMVVRGITNGTEYPIYQLVTDLLHQDVPMDRALLIAQKHFGVILYENKRDIFTNYN